MSALPITETDFVFDKRQTVFPSNAHRVAWYLGASLLPFVKVIPDGLSDSESADLADGEKQLYAFFKQLYASLYQNPGNFHMEETPDLFFNDGEWYKDRPDMTRAKGKNAHVVKALEVLFEIGHRAVIENGHWVISAVDYANIFDEIRPNSISRPKVKGFLADLQKFGLIIVSEKDTIHIQSTQFPKLLFAMKAMCQYRNADERALRFFAFYRCDYQAVQGSYRPDLSLVLDILTQDALEKAERIISFMQESGYTIELQMGGYPSAAWVVKFNGSKIFKASSFFFFGFSIEYLNMFYLELHCMNPQYLIPLVYQKGDEYTGWFDRTWTRDCDDCGFCKDKFKNPGPYAFEYHGKTRGLCHQCWMKARNPSKEQVDTFLKMVALHTDAGMAG
jgi:hypothetical protein